MHDAFSGIEAANQISPAYAYILNYQDSDERVFLTGYERNIEMEGVPARFLAADPQTFLAAQITHGEHGLSAEFDRRPLTVMLTTQSTALSRFFATASATRIGIAIFRLNSTKLLTGETLTWDIDAILLTSGIVGKITFGGQQISVEVAPEPHGQNQAVPRFFFSRTCNHQLGQADTCKVNLASYTHAATIAEIDTAQRIITLSITPPGGNAEYFRAGVFLHVPSGQRFGIDWSDGAGTAGKARVRLKYWTPELIPGDAVTVRAGCRHTTSDCASKFGNLANFGGFPHIPNRNPSLHGVGV